MPLPLILTKFKGLLPVAVVGGAVAITIKLLTQETPTSSKIMHVEAEEDIAKVDEHVEELEPEPQPEEEPAKEDKEESDDEAAVEEEEDGEEGEDDDSSDEDSEEQTQEKQPQSQEQEEPKSSGRAFIKGPMGDLLKDILGTGKE